MTNIQKSKQSDQSTPFKNDEISRNQKTAKDVKKKHIPSKKSPNEDGIQTSQGQDPTRYGDWEKNGRAIDF